MDIDAFLYGNSSVEPNPLRGQLLVAEPMLSGDVFERAVVVMLDVDRQLGHLGLVLNKPLNTTLRELAPSWSPDVHLPVFCGGPVDLQRLFVLHTLGDVIKGASKVTDGLYVGGDLHSIMDYVEYDGDVEGKMRFFLGYSGWSKDQLQSEIIRHSWTVNSAPDYSTLLTGYGEGYWRREVTRLGENYRSWLSVPSDPALN